MDLIENIQQSAAKLHREVTSFRRHFHQHPELSFEEHQTSRFICDFLDREDIPYRQGYAGTGIVAFLEGKPGKGSLALRAELDALPIQENTGSTYSSLNPGVMHACGHDVHMASLMGTLLILKQLRHEFPGTVWFIFQPGEEKLPGGAKRMLEEGALEKARPHAMLAQHVLPELPCGKVGIRAGEFMASSDELYLDVTGKGGHAARPQDTTDNILAASKIIVTLKEWFHQNPESQDRAILSFGKITGMGATNVIPDKVKAEGTLRTMDEPFRNAVHKNMKAIVSDIASTMTVKAELEIRKGYPVLVNDEKTTQQFRTLAEAYLGKGNVVELDKRMTSEDFAYFSQLYPSCFYRLGSGSPGRDTTYSLHTAHFAVDENTLLIGPGLMAWAALSSLRSWER